MPRTKLRTPQLRDHVLSVAVATLAAEGITGFTTRAVARQARTSTPAVYELFGDKAGLLREVCFAGFTRLRQEFGELTESAEPRADLIAVAGAFRAFARQNPALAQVMFSRPFADFDPRPADREAGTSVREFIVARVRRCTAAGLLHGDDTDIAHVLLALAQGLAVQEAVGWLGSSPASRDRRWDLAVRAVLDGLA